MWETRFERFPVHPPRTREYYLLRSMFESHVPHPDAIKTVPQVRGAGWVVVVVAAHWQQARVQLKKEVCCITRLLYDQVGMPRPQPMLPAVVGAPVSRCKPSMRARRLTFCLPTLPLPAGPVHRVLHPRGAQVGPRVGEHARDQVGAGAGLSIGGGWAG